MPKVFFKNDRVMVSRQSRMRQKTITGGADGSLLFPILQDYIMIFSIVILIIHHSIATLQRLFFDSLKKSNCIQKFQLP